MTPKGKAEQIVENIRNEISWMLADGYNSTEVFKAAKQCALIVLRDTVWGYLDQQSEEIQKYWQEVKREIEKL